MTQKSWFVKTIFLATYARILKLLNEEFWAKRRITVQEHLDGSIHMAYRGREVVFTEIKELPQKPPIPHQKQEILTPRRKYIPPPTHPWRRFNLQSTWGKETTLI